MRLVRNGRSRPIYRLDKPEAEEIRFVVGAVFFAIGHTMNTEHLEGVGVQMDDECFPKTHSSVGGGQTETGFCIYCAGDAVDSLYQQVVTTAGMSCRT